MCSPRYTNGGGIPAEEIALHEASHFVIVEGVNLENVLPSSTIKRSRLQSVEETENLPNLPAKLPSNAGKMAVLLAREALFGLDVLERCAPLRAGNLPALPVEELKG